MGNEQKIPKQKDNETLAFWKAQIDSATEYLRPYVERGCRIEDRYREEHSTENYDSRYRGANDCSYNILYSNTETIRPIIFSEVPEPDVRANDLDSVANRSAAQMLEDSLSLGIKQPKTMASLRSATKDYLLAGTGVIRVRYKPTFEVNKITTTDMDDNGEIIEVNSKEEKLTYEEVCYEHVLWRDLIYPDFMAWDKLPWIAFKCLYTYAEAKEQFGKKADLLNYCYTSDDKNDKQEHYSPHDNKFGLAKVYEVWDKTNRKVVWVSNAVGLDTPVKIDDDPLELDDFFPIPEPLFSVQTTSEIKPVPFFVEYQDLANELDVVSTRIKRNVENLKRRGVYDASVPELQRLSEAVDNEFVAVKDFSRIQAKGGIKNVIDSEDITVLVGVIQSLYQQRDQIINSIYQITGYSDILRGQTDPRETLGAQRIKGRFGTLRISEQQREVQRFIRDALQIGAQVIINKFEDRTIALQTNIPIEEIARYKEILQITEPSTVMVDVQTDSTIAADDFADKETAIEFIGAIGEFVQRAPIMVQSIGLSATSEILMTMLKRFKMGRNVELAIMDHIKVLTAQESQPKPPTPEMIEAQTEQTKVQVDTQIKMAELQLKSKELEIRAAEIGLKDQIEKQKLDLQAVDVALKQLALVAEAENPNDNAIVGV